MASLPLTLARLLRRAALRLASLLQRLETTPVRDSLLPDHFFGSIHEFALVCRRSTQVAGAGPGTNLCRVMGMFLIFGDATDVGLVPHLAMDGYWEPATTLALARAIRPGWTCVDVGANHGYFTVLMAHAVGTTGAVIACEPHPGLVELLRCTLSVNGFTSRVTVHAVAVGKSDDEIARLEVPTRFSMNGSLVSGASQNSTGHDVPVSTLDTILGGRPVNLIKIDVEGAEELVWAGMQGTVTASPMPVLVFEFNTRRHNDPRTFLDGLTTAGYSLAVIENDGTVHAATRERILTEHPGDDWMLWLEPSSPR